MRKVKYFEYDRLTRGRIAMGIATFLAWGVDYEELNDGVGTFSTALIELDDGTVKNVPVENIEFVRDWFGG